ncbi:IS5 family transposase [Actinokineospora sp. 24-640]
MLPPSGVRPQGGGTQNIADEAVFAAIVYVLVSGCAWRALPPCFGAARSTVHRRFTIWARAGVFVRLHREILERLRESGLLDLSRVLLDSAHIRAKKGEHTGPSPVDRGKPGTKMHILSDRTGMPLVTAVSRGNTHDANGLNPMLAALLARHDPDRGRHWKPRKLHPDKAYDTTDLRRWLRRHRIRDRIARKGVDSSHHLGRYRWVIERTIAWMLGCRRLSPRYERNPRNHLAFIDLAASLTCWKRHLRTQP